MQTQSTLTTSRQRQRLRLWAMALLAWMAALATGALLPSARQWRQRRWRMSLAGLRRTIFHLLILRAADLKPLAPRKLRFSKHGRTLLRRHFFRSLIGSRIRKAMSDKAPLRCIVKLMAFLRDLDTWALAFAKRRAVTRLWHTRPATRFAPITPSAPAAVAIADSS